MDLKLSSVSKDARCFTVESKIGIPRIILCLLFGVPCFFLISYAFRQQGGYVLIALLFCPALAILSLLFGMAKQKKCFIPSSGCAIKSFQIFNIHREMKIPLPRNGTLLTYKQWSSGNDTGGCYFYHIEVQGLVGFGFCISKDEARRNEFTRDLAVFLHYEICEQPSL